MQMGTIFAKDTCSIIFSQVTEPRTHIANTLVLVTKQYLYRKRCCTELPTKKGLEHMYKLESYNAVKKNNSAKHKRKWEPLFTKGIR